MAVVIEIHVIERMHEPLFILCSLTCFVKYQY